MKFLVLTLLTHLFAFTCVAQFNDSTNYYIKLASTGVVNKTNEQDAYLLNNALRFSFYKKSISINTNNSWIYGKQQGNVSNNDFTSTLDFDLFKSERHLYYWGLLNYEKSVSLKISNRFQGGLGVGYYIIDRDDFVIQISDGVLYERSNLYEEEGSPSPDYETYRNSLRLKFRFVLANRVTLDGVDFVQHSFEDFRDYIIRSNTNLAVKVWKWVSLNVSLTYNKLNITKRENLLLNYGITVEKYF
jgi:hypothetical protein